jgi:hypothetical protein
MPLYSQIIEQEIKGMISNYPGLDTLSEEMKIEITENIHQDVVSKYETIVYDIADSIAQDSLERGNLLPPVYASEYYLQNKETQERKYFLSTEYLEKKLWKNWDYVYILVNKKTGDVVEIEKKDYKEEEWIAKGYKKKSFGTVKLKDGHEPKISPDFDFNDPQINQDVLHGEDYLILVVTWDLDKSKEKSFEKLNELYKHSVEKEYKFYGATSTVAKAEVFKKHNKVEFNFASADEKILKTIVRSNPGVLLIKNGIVIKKWGENSIPTSKKLEKVIKKWEEKK